MHDEIFADGVGEITVTGNVVRIDLVSLSPTQRDANNNPSAVFRQRVIMPVDGFANTAQLMKNVLGKLVKSGVVKMQPAPQPATAAALPGGPKSR